MSRTTKGYKREQGLTIEQLNAIDLLVIGKTDKEVADKIGVNRVTITKWRNYDIYFRAEMNKRRNEIWGASLDKMRSLVPKALERLENEIDNDNGWKVALEVIKIAGIENKHINEIEHDDAEKILNDEAEKRYQKDLFSNVSDYTKKELLDEYRKKLETI
ncbi:hypothetical protein V7148_20545 [Gottfriedia acidiceleris]|uniref:hypothetical protein n=1 Tax=Gottfriedia acidiceleris TaxID=371036 RepID=UPI002FFF53ED